MSELDSTVFVCADVGSTRKSPGSFGWWSSAAVYGDDPHGDDPCTLVKHVVNHLTSGHSVALGFECPLYVPLASNQKDLTRARQGECLAGHGNRPWSVGAGAQTLVVGLVQVTWVLDQIRLSIKDSVDAHIEWGLFQEKGGLFLWEAFVTSEAKGSDHAHDAKIAVSKFTESLPNPEGNNAILEPKVFSLIGAAALRTGWANNVNVLSERCLVIKA